MPSFKRSLSNLFNLRSGKASHVALGLLTYLGSSQAIGVGLTMAGLPGGAFLVGGIAGAFLGFSNYYALQGRRYETSFGKNAARNVGYTLSAAFGAATAATIFSAGAATLPVMGALAIGAGVMQYMALPKQSAKTKVFGQRIKL
jgi:hypothetical protein